MATETQQPKSEQKPQQFTADTVIVINCLNSCGFDSEANTVIVGRNADAILEVDRGLLVQRKEGTGAQKTIERYLIPWANVKSVKYATQPAPAEKKAAS